MELKHCFELTCHDLFFVIVVTFGIFGIATEIKLCMQYLYKSMRYQENWQQYKSKRYQEYFVEETETVLVIIGDQQLNLDYELSFLSLAHMFSSTANKSIYVQRCKQRFSFGGDVGLDDTFGQVIYDDDGLANDGE